MGTLGYYDSHAAHYAADTAGADMTEIQDRFLALLPSGARILDLGCGCGRDSLRFSTLGCSVSPVDGSQEMCRIAERTCGLPVRQLLFTGLDYEAVFDGIWACASLLHVPSAELGHVFALCRRALVPGGILYTSFKYGTYEGQRDGRHYTDLTEQSLGKHISGLFSPIDIFITCDARPGRQRKELWLNMLAAGL